MQNMNYEIVGYVSFLGMQVPEVLTWTVACLSSLRRGRRQSCMIPNPIHTAYVTRIHPALIVEP